jgi:hypothetical protein
MNKLWDKVGANPWDIEIARAVKRGIDPQKVRTFTIFQWMLHGDFRPLITAIRDNQQIDHTLLNEFVAYMALEGRLTVKRHRGRPRDPEAKIRDMIAAMAYDDAKGAKVNSEDRFKLIADAVGRGDKSVRRAVTARRKSNSK